MKQAIMIGAGNIGRGFIGAILSRSGYHVTFADVNMTLIDAINAEGRYTVHIQDRDPAAFTITNIDGISSAGPELAEALKTAELVTTAVGLRILPIVAKPIAAGIAARKAAGNAAPLNIVAGRGTLRLEGRAAANRRHERRGRPLGLHRAQALHAEQRPRDLRVSRLPARPSHDPRQRERSGHWSDRVPRDAAERRGAGEKVLNGRGEASGVHRPHFCPLP